MANDLMSPNHPRRRIQRRLRPFHRSAGEPRGLFLEYRSHRVLAMKGLDTPHTKLPNETLQVYTVVIWQLSSRYSPVGPSRGANQAYERKGTKPKLLMLSDAPRRESSQIPPWTWPTDLHILCRHGHSVRGFVRRRGRSDKRRQRHAESR